MNRRGASTNRVGAGAGDSSTPSVADGAQERERERTRMGEQSPVSSLSPSPARSNASNGSRESNASGAGGAQFVAIRSRVGKRYQAMLPELRTSRASVTKGEEEAQDMESFCVMHLPKARYSLDRATALGGELEKYLSFARSLRDGATFDTDEQVNTSALQYLHRFDYNPTDAACSLYARHSMEMTKSDSEGVDNKSDHAGGMETQWVTAFYRLMRLPWIRLCDYQEMLKLQSQAGSLGIAITEVGVLERLITRLADWMKAYEDCKNSVVDRGKLQSLLYKADDLAFDLDEKKEIEHRIHAFDLAYGRLKDGIDSNSRRSQTKAALGELEVLFAAVTKVKVNFPEMSEFSSILQEARTMKTNLQSILAKEKVSLTAMRDMMAKMELVPVNFEKEIDIIQQKMLTAQSWLAKVRKCVPKRRISRRGGPEPKKMDREAIRALVDDAPCDDTAEMFEMQDLLECAEDWADKVKHAIDGGSDVSLAELKELMEVGTEMPIDMEEQQFLEAEISAREWCVKATAILAAKKPLKELENAAEEAKIIRTLLHPRKQSRWKPQVERDIDAAVDTTLRWVNEVRDILGPNTFEKMFASSIPLVDVAPPQSDVAHIESTQSFAKGKKFIESIVKVMAKSERLVVDVHLYSDRLEEMLSGIRSVQAEVQEMLKKIGARDQVAPYEGDSSFSPDLNRTSSTNEAVVQSVGTPKQHATELHAVISLPPKRSKDARLFMHACNLLDRISSLPLIFDEALTLHEIVQSEKRWAERVHDALPPRQSRKKRKANNPTTLDQVKDLLTESTSLHFTFPDEMKLLEKELDDVAAWQQKARGVVESRVSHFIGTVARNLKDYDLIIYNKLHTVKDSLKTVSDVDFDQEEQLGKCETVKAEVNTSYSTDIEMHDINQVSAPIDSKTQELPTAGGSANKEVLVTLQHAVDPVNVSVILDTIRREAMCPIKLDDVSGKEQVGVATKPASGISVLDPLLAMVEESLTAVNRVEVKEGKSNRRLEELLLNEDGIYGPPDDSVQELENWRDQISDIFEEGNLFNIVPPELEALSIVMELLEWLQGSRSIFYDEPFPLSDLVTKGKELHGRMDTIMDDGSGLQMFSKESWNLLGILFYPLEHLVAHEQVVHSWVHRVEKCMEDKHAPVDIIQDLLTEAYELLLEPAAFKLILDEVKKAKAWLSKLKKRLKSSTGKHARGLSPASARSMVDEGDDLRLEIPAFDLLKEHVHIASDWETRVLSSGIETGQAHIATLIGLLDEYDRARLVVDMTMHRDVLKSATERYCVCRQPYDGFMIGCDHCEDWFHDNCIGMSKEKAEKTENYTCPSCNILFESSYVLQRTVNDQNKLWSGEDYEKNYEKQHGAAVRKVKREAKAIERAEMLLFSCRSHMNQLRTRIDDIERAKACFTLPNPFHSIGSVPADASGPPAVAQTAAASPESQPPAITSSNDLSSAPSVSSGSTENPPSQTSIGFPSSTPANPFALAHDLVNTVIPSAEPSADLPSVADRATVGSYKTGSVGSNISANDNSQSQPVGTGEKQPTTPTLTKTMPSMLAPMLARLSENTERLSALLVAGGVEQQLGKMKHEHTEIKAQVKELEDTIEINKERLVAAQKSLDELKRAFVIRQHGLPRAKAWVQRIVYMLNLSSTLDYSKFQSGFISSELQDMILDAKAKEIESFPEVKTYIHLVRVVSWTLVVVALLQQRPSREKMTEAISYASEYELWESAKPTSPLRAIIGRVDGWISRTHKCLTKSATVPQKATRLKVLLNEYSKLPLTCLWISKIEEYIKLIEMNGNGNTMTTDELMKSQAEAEAAALSAVSSALSVSASSTVAKAPRKRKMYTKKDKAGAGAGTTSIAMAKKDTKKAKMATAARMAASSPSCTASAITDVADSRQPLNVEENTTHQYPGVALLPAPISSSERDELAEAAAILTATSVNTSNPPA